MLHSNTKRKQKSLLQSFLIYIQTQKKKRNSSRDFEKVYNILPETKQLIDQNLTGIFAKEKFSVEKVFFLF